MPRPEFLDLFTLRLQRSLCYLIFKDIFVPLTIGIDQTRRALAIDFPCYSTLEIVSIIIIIILV